MSKAKFDAAKELIDSKSYAEARALLKTIDHPTARQWETKLDKLDPPAAQMARLKAAPAAPAVKPALGLKRFWRNLWGVLTLLSIGWMCYGVYVSSMAFTEVAATTTSEAGKGGAAIGASLGLTGFICIGLPFFLLFAVLYWRNGVAIQKAKDHAEMMTALQTRQ